VPGERPQTRARNKPRELLCSDCLPIGASSRASALRTSSRHTLQLPASPPRPPTGGGHLPRLSPWAAPSAISRHGLARRAAPGDGYASRGCPVRSPSHARAGARAWVGAASRRGRALPRQSAGNVERANIFSSGRADFVSAGARMQRPRVRANSPKQSGNPLSFEVVRPAASLATV